LPGSRVDPVAFVEKTAKEIHISESFNFKCRVNVNFTISRLLLFKVALDDDIVNLVVHFLSGCLILSQVVHDVTDLGSGSLGSADKEVKELIDDKLFVFWLTEEVVSKQVIQEVNTCVNLRLVFPSLSFSRVVSDECSQCVAVFARQSLRTVQGPQEELG